MTAPTLYTVHPSPLGDLLLAGPAPGELASVSLPDQRYAPRPDAGWRRDPAVFAEVTRQLDAYFAGELTTFALRRALSLTPGGTVPGSDFRRRVWEAVDRIPYGHTVSYGALAADAGLPARSVRAVGGAVGRNPLSIVRPCHRVVGADGSLTGYAGGMDCKRRLLELEGALR